MNAFCEIRKILMINFYFCAQLKNYLTIMAKVIGLGNALVDIMTPLENDDIINQINFPKGSMQLVDSEKSREILDLTAHIKSKLASGGSAANTIHGMARLGMESAFVGKIGPDKFGDIFKNDLIDSN
ncbi:MAG: hypothetical protein GQ527_04990, partial [Bacteroidales bacterium]|nr:hypothetical protein [Bacteroidales bacterium]